MLFDRHKKTVNWTLSGRPCSARRCRRSPSSGGYAIAVSTVDPSLLLRPDVAGATQAAVVDDGPSSAAAAAVAAGPQTTGLYAVQAALGAAQQRKGLQYEWLLAGVALPAGRATAGRRWRAPPLRPVPEHQQRAPRPGGRVAHPGAPRVAPILTTPNQVGYHAVFANWAYQFAAIDPLATARDAKLQIIGSQNGPSYGHAY